MKTMPVEFQMIGIILSPYETPKDAPCMSDGTPMEIEIYPDYQDALTDIDGFTHLHVIYWLHRSQGYSLLVTTPWEQTPHGLFATRSPHRPNPIGYSVVTIISRNKNRLLVTGLDAINETPVIDIKPYISFRDAVPNAKNGWLEKLRSQ
ncbi:MAG: tRNA (N6-threonylcarbamoyladenosine(37)-N6)-methyltransferase TrmO [Candidatus Thermoplasmatota archaeon]|nr:tRNA (N6-threonylcarbamoyladenosine(37)-N6)-methyltransferase TrmO [Candidatus Thermoplasmatota archaeon]MBU1941578.1 tRNA (N6-threonylcarbamoyladenosine(37)-N6)-methyltransferase TrmO [Candidatus Thermoplasmatota archaeon]